MSIDNEGAGHMKAAVYREYGAPDVLRQERVQVPEVAEQEILVRVAASTVNRTDCGFLRGRPRIVRLFSGLLRPKATILGCEFAGEVVKLGSGVDDYAVGDRVFGYKDDDYGFGGHAEFTVMPVAGMVAKIPQHLSYLQAAPALEGAHYALHSIRAANITSGTTVLINGATGAIGSSALQIIKHMGAQVTAVCATQHMEQIKALGADVVIDYTQQDFTQLPDKFDVVLDAVGKSTFGQCRRILNKEGIYLSTELGPYWQNPLLAIAHKFIGKQRVKFPIPTNTQQDAHYLRDLMEKDVYRPLLDTSYPLEEVAEAFRYVETGMKTGNVVIQIQPSL